MITRALKARGSADGVLDYNEEKVAENMAAVVALNRIPDDSPYTIYKTFREREANPAISARARNLAFHMAVNPGVDDDITEDDVLNYIADIMDGLGMGDQPYVVYRHNDIEREHYHVVSTKVEENGHIIGQEFVGLRLMTLQRDLAKKYGFTVGLPDAEEAKEAPEAQPLVPGSDNVIARMRANVEAAFKYGSRTGTQMRAVLLAYGLELRRAEQDGRRVFSFRGVGPDGRRFGRPIGLKRVTGLTSDQFLERIGDEAKKKAKASGKKRERLVDEVRKAFSASATADEMRDRLASRGISMLCLSAAGKMPARLSEAVDIQFVDTARMEVVSVSETGIPLASILAMTRGGRKKTEDRDNMKKPAKKVGK